MILFGKNLVDAFLNNIYFFLEKAESKNKANS